MEEQRFAERKTRFAFSKAGSKTTEWRAFGSVTIVVPGREPIVIKNCSWVIYCNEADQPGELRSAELQILSALDGVGLEATLRALKERVIAFFQLVLFIFAWVLLGFALHDPVYRLFD